MKLLLIGVFTVAVVWNIYLYLLPEKTTVWNYGFNIVYACLFAIGGMSGVMVMRSGGHKSTMGKSVIFLGAGLLFYTVGLLIWAYYNLVLHVEIPYPSIADVFYIWLFIPSMAIGCLYLLSLVSGLLLRRQILESVGIVLVSSLLSFLIHRPDLSSDLPFYTLLMNVAYPLGDTIILSLSIMIFRLSGGKMNRSSLHLMIGLLFHVVADFTYVYRLAHEVYWNGDIADTLYMIAGSLESVGVISLAATFLTPAQPIPEHPSEHTEVMVSRSGK